MAVTQEAFALRDPHDGWITAPVQASVSIAKRMLDVALATVALVVFSPLLLLVALAVFVSSPGSVAFRQTRVGQNGQLFRLVKFRTMVHDAEERLHADPALYQLYLENDHKLPPDLDPRVTRLGRFLRASSLDELPQLWNVLTGDMTIVGPRPVVPPELENYGEFKDVYMSVRPGLTGAWQASGRSTLSYDERVMLDVEYVENWSMWTDVKLILKTVPAVVRRQGAH